MSRFTLRYKCRSCNQQIDQSIAAKDDVELEEDIRLSEQPALIFHSCWEVKDYAIGRGILDLVGYTKMEGASDGD